MKNYDKYEAYKAMKVNLSKALRTGFYYQAIFIEYAIIEDRCLSLLQHAGVKWKDNRDHEVKLSTKLNKIRTNPMFASLYVRKRLTADLIDEIEDWKRERDKLIHALARIKYDDESVRNVAERGAELVRILDNKVRSVNEYFDKKTGE